MKKTLSLLLAMLMLASCFASCSENNTDDGADSSNPSDPSVSSDITETVPEETEITRQNMPDSLPEKMDFNSVDINFIYVDSDIKNANFTLMKTREMRWTPQYMRETSPLRNV